MKKYGWLAATLGLVAAILSFATMANYAFPGESAHLMAIWKGLDVADTPLYPLMAVFAKMLGGGNLIAPVCGALATALVTLLVAAFVDFRMRGQRPREERNVIALIAGGVAGVVFMLTPAVREASTHLAPRLFDFVWLALTASLLIPYAVFAGARKISAEQAADAKEAVGAAAMSHHSEAKVTAGAERFLTPIIALMVALGACDSVLFVVMVPVFVAVIALILVHNEKRPYGAAFVFLLTFFVALPLLLKGFSFDMGDYLKGIAAEFRAYYGVPGWLFVTLFSTVPFVVALFSSDNAYNQRGTLVLWLFHGAMSFVSILSVATILSPSVLMEPYGTLPILTSAFAAAVAGYLVSFWYLHRRRAFGRPGAVSYAWRPVSLVAGGLLVFVLVTSGLWNLFTFDRARGAFADKMAERILADLGTRKWFISEGTLDDHLRLAAARKGQELNLISLVRDLDETYLARLGDLLAAKNLGGPKNGELRLSLTLGVLPFVQDWFASDPTIASEVAIYGAPDLWYSAGLKAIPEVLFFGADPKRPSDWKAAWKDLDEILKAPKDWGSYGIRKVDNPIDRMRLSLRRHLGLVANDRGVYLLDNKRQDEAFEMFELTLNEIDRDNVCALFNEIEMAWAKYPKAVGKQHELERLLKKIVDDKDRRYNLWRLGNYYGYIRNPDIFVRLGFNWAQSGRAGEALAQIRRAIDIVPTDKRTALLNMMASLYASENNRAQSRAIYEQVLAKNANDHDALIGLMRIEMMNGNSEAAKKYLERAAGSATGPRADMEMALLAMMKNEHAKARDLLRKLTAADEKNLEAWSLLAAVTMQMSDSSKDRKERAAYDKELSKVILPAMEKQTTDPFNYYVQTTKAFLLMRQGTAKRKEARDAFATAAKARPDLAATQDIVLSLDISLDDEVAAERHARESLRKNRKAPLPNYVMGSLALKKGNYREAEAFLRKAADAPKPQVLALNDLAEVLRRRKSFAEAERYARRATELAPKLYVAWETLGSSIIDGKGNLDEAEKAIRKALELSRDKSGRETDIRILVSLVRVQVLRKDFTHARTNIRKIRARINELSAFEQKEFEEYAKSVR